MRISATFPAALFLLWAMATSAAGYQAHLMDDAGVPAEFGPVRQPDAIIEPPSELGTIMGSYWRLPPRTGGEMEGLVIGNVTRANVWAMLVYFWPEFLFLFLLLGLLIAFWRIVKVWRHPQVAGQPLCRRCGYSLAGTAIDVTATCPECGTMLKSCNRIIGRSQRRRLLAPGMAALLLGFCAGVLFWFWYPPVGSFDRWGAQGPLPRHGSVSTWFDWPSTTLWRWGDETGLWPEMESSHYGQVWLVDLNAGRVEKMVLEWTAENLFVQGDVVDMNRDRVMIESESGRMFRFDRASGESAEIKDDSAPDMSDDERGGRDSREWLTPDFRCKVVDDELQVRRSMDDQLIDRIPAPAPVYMLYEDGISEDGRFAFARAGQTMVVVFDRRTRRWLGRFDASGNASHRSHLRRIELAHNRWLVIPTNDTRMSIMKFDLHKYAR